MAGDMKLNVWQKTQGEIKRMIKKAGGVGKLRKEVGGMDVD
jgi:nucleolar protein 16